MAGAEEMYVVVNMSRPIRDVLPGDGAFVCSTLREAAEVYQGVLMEHPSHDAQSLQVFQLVGPIDIAAQLAALLVEQALEED